MAVKPVPLYVAATAHGFGHVTRLAAVVNALRRRDPNVLPIWVTPAPRWLLERYVEGPFLHRQRALDVGVVQPDGLQADLPATLAALKTFKAGAEALIQEEAEFIRAQGIPLVLADVPPLAAAIAQAARIPCWMASNFGWDFIYQEYGPQFQPFVVWIRELYGRCQRLFRLPFAEPMGAFPYQEAVGLTGSDPRYLAEEVAQRLGLERERPTVLLTFGGLGLQGLPYGRLEDFPDWQFLTFDQQAPALPNLRVLDGQVWRPVDVMPLCRWVVSKPGYGTLAEALRCGTPMACVNRFGFAESPLLVEGLRRYGWHRILSAEEFFEGSWDFLRDPPHPPQAPEELDRGGNEAIAGAIAAFLGQ
ncbi:glycosyl transferase [Synechococcus sp. O70.2]|jgi:UDP:flavonoid glycosyltransferase YjiC (YdhE family)|uniref:glycosyl transferase n=1 Tax=Synechococcus sp. O70.2 TaxID=2964533 RepID=UPI0039C149E8